MKILLVLLLAALLFPAAASAQLTVSSSTPLSVPYNAASSVLVTSDVAQVVQLTDNPYWLTDRSCPVVTVSRGKVRRVCQLLAGDSVTYYGPVRSASSYVAASGSTGDFASVVYTITSTPEPYAYVFWRSGCRVWLPGSCV